MKIIWFCILNIQYNIIIIALNFYDLDFSIYRCSKSSCKTFNWRVRRRIQIYFNSYNFKPPHQTTLCSQHLSWEIRQHVAKLSIFRRTAFRLEQNSGKKSFLPFWMIYEGEKDNISRSFDNESYRFILVSISRIAILFSKLSSIP